MNFASVCSGIGAPEVAWRPMWGEPVFVSEIEKFPSAVLAHHMPSVPNFGDFTRIANAGPEPDRPVDLLVGGTPCQAFSVAGKRAGLDDPRGNLTLEYLALARRLRPRWLVWENVPGVLSIDDGRTFGTFLGLLGECGYGWAYRILDAQHFGVPQRRRRVFVVGHLGGWQRAAAVLFEPESLRGDSAPSRETREGIAHAVAPSIGASGRGFSRAGETRGQDPVVAMALNAKGGSGRIDGESKTFVTHSLRADGFDASEDGTGRGTPLVPVAFAQNSRDEVRLLAGDGGLVGALGAEPGMKQQSYVAFSCKDRGADAGELAPTLRSMGHDGSHANAGGQLAVAIQEVGKRTGVSTTDPRAGIGIAGPDDPMFTLQAGAQHGVGTNATVRRLTPRECERLQGFPDDFTLIPWRSGMAPDGPRYKALGNSMAVPVLKWIGERIAFVDPLRAQQGSGS